jgi:hypothetical protein
MKSTINNDPFRSLYFHSVMHKPAYPTNRVVGDGLSEWIEPCIIKGAPAKIYYIFNKHESNVDDACDMPFDVDHAVKIEIAEKNDDGKYETI